MSAADAFTRFIDVLANTLDEGATTADELASRLHLSRFHAHRLIVAAADEPPGALRRRIMLERAAYRLISTRDGVLAVAVDTGYSSHEAFTRAFKRAYGSPPSAWRRRPTHLQVASANGIHFNPPGGIRLPAEGKVTE